MVLKRKPSVHGVCIDPKKKVTPRKPPTKSDMAQEIKILKNLNDALEKENKTQAETIAVLQQKLANPAKKVLGVSISTETESSSEDIKIPCNICVYIATCEEELSWHMGEEHDLPSDSCFGTDFPCDICGKWCRSASDLINHLKKHELGINRISSQPAQNQTTKLQCNFCDENFKTIGELMLHKKGQHRDKVSQCWKHSSGTCDFGEEFCWFIHGENNKGVSYKREFNCSECGKDFTTKYNLLVHKKIEHKRSVQKCRNIGSCSYGPNCGFQHDEFINNEENVTKEVMRKLFNMIENLTNKVVTLDNKIGN